MTELKIAIAPEKEHLIKMLVEELGGEVIDRNQGKGADHKKSKRGAVSKTTKKAAGQPSPTFLFGKWKDLDLDAGKLRTEAWDRGSKFL